ncbi:phage tail protein [Terracoccus sp. 273MFTsu3.1]|uniref:phage tail protein n=1 Tax=Terracoccus sp. 273MFTsu3.1 TaxID=1172188 RepID=UPI000368BEFA|nr:phage tail protein [Terracoccus sp. 273MFTsu3.1]
MATYGISLYGRSKYGPTTSIWVDYLVEPFIAEATDYSTISLSWRSPKGDWTAFRLVKNFKGFPSSEKDGTILFESTSARSSFLDTNVTPGAWHYYSIWVKSGAGVWQPSAQACALMLEDHGYAQRLFDSLPKYHQLTQGLTDNAEEAENDDLRRFLTVLGMGLDYAKTYYKSLLFVNDPLRNRVSQLASLADQFGISFSPASPSGLFRKRVLNAGTLAREKGTYEGIRNILTLATGWDVDVYTGSNLMLHEDAASFIHPTYATWDPAVNYPAGERVSFNGFLYAAKTGGAYGDPQKPSGTTATNTWWTNVSNLADTTLKAADGSVAGWSPVSFTAGVNPPTDQVALGVGVQSPTDPTVNYANTLLIRNTAATTADLGARSAGGDLSDPATAIQRGVPLPRPLPWDATVEYGIGDYVTYSSRAYVAASESQNVTPGTNTRDWVMVSDPDGRTQVTVSLHAKGIDAASQGRTVYPVLDVFDDHGALITTVDGSKDTTALKYDSFRSNAPGVTTTLSGAAPEYGTGTWSVSGQCFETGGVGAVLPKGSLVVLIGTADGVVSTTFEKQSPGLTQGLILRYASINAYLLATRVGLFSVSTGTPTLIANYSTPFADGERIYVTLSGANITVKKGTTTVLTTSSTFNQTSTYHGISVS